MSKAKRVGAIKVNEEGATLKDVLGAMLKLKPEAVKRVVKKVRRRKAK